MNTRSCEHKKMACAITVYARLCTIVHDHTSTSARYLRARRAAGAMVTAAAEPTHALVSRGLAGGARRHGRGVAARAWVRAGGRGREQQRDALRVLPHGGVADEVAAEEGEEAEPHL